MKITFKIHALWEGFAEIFKINKNVRTRRKYLLLIFTYWNIIICLLKHFDDIIQTTRSKFRSTLVSSKILLLCKRFDFLWIFFKFKRKNYFESCSKLARPALNSLMLLYSTSFGSHRPQSMFNSGLRDAGWLVNKTNDYGKIKTNCVS